MKLENWQLIHTPFYHLIGDIYGDIKNRFKDGDPIRTSEIEIINFKEGVVKTRNSVYILGAPHGHGTLMYPKNSEEETRAL